ncbi:hypothetical protein HZC00_02495 [Candidatus Kaiserbacteria bacterium]|nr:hypothetical protein [Candidatus Kaiserbacteria bacterium]
MFKPWQVILFLLVVVLGVVGFIFWYYTPGMGSNANTNTEVAPVATDTQATVSAAVDTSNASLDADLSAVDNQIKVVGSDSASVDDSLNDKPVAQTE